MNHPCMSAERMHQDSSSATRRRSRTIASTVSGDPMVSVVVGEEREPRVLVLRPAVKHGLISGNHLVELARAVHHMDKVGWANARHFPSGVAIGMFLLRKQPDFGT